MENDKGLEGLPDVDLNKVVDDLKTNQDKDKEGKTSGKDLDLAQFKNAQDLLKSYKEIQSAFTKVSQENKMLKEQSQQQQEQLELSRLAAAAPPGIPQQQNNNDGTADTARQYYTFRIAEVLEEEADKNKAEFNERYAYAELISREYPNLARTPKGVKKLFELGDKLRNDNLRKNAGKALESIFGEPLTEEEITRLRTMVKGDKTIQSRTSTNAYMPDTSTSTKTGQDQNQKPNFDRQIEESVEKGDVDGVLSATFKRILAE